MRLTSAMVRVPLSYSRRVRSSRIAEALAGGLGEPDRLARREHVGVGRVEVVDLEPDGVLVLGLEHALRPGGDERPRRPLVGHVERIGDVHVVLERAAGALRANSCRTG